MAGGAGLTMPVAAGNATATAIFVSMGAQTMAGGAGMMGNVAAGNATAMAMFVTKVIATNQSNDHHPLFSMLPCVHRILLF